MFTPSKIPSQFCFENQMITMKINSILFSVFTMFLSFGSIAQDMIHNTDGSPMKSKRSTEVDGSVYLHTDWTSAEIKLNSGEMVSRKAKFNFFEGQIEFLMPGNEEPRVYEKHHISSIVFYQNAKEAKGELTLMVFKNGFSNIEGRKELDLFNVLSEGKYSFLRFYKPEVQGPGGFSSYEPSRNATITKRELFYVLNENGESFQILRNKAAIIKATNEKDKINQIMKDEKLNINKDADLKKLFDILNGSNV
jgi:hypothetical protein